MNKPASNDLPTASLNRGSVQDLIWWLLTGYILLILIGAVWLHAGNISAGGQSLNYDRAVFISVSTATLTGFQTSIGANDFKSDSVQGPLVLIVLTLAGSLLAMTIGGLAAVRILRLPFTDKQVIFGALGAELLAILAGTAALCTGHADLVDAVLQSACAFGNSGAVITAKIPGAIETRSRFPAFDTWRAQCVLLPLSIAGGLGLPVVMELYHRLFGGVRKLSTHSRTVIVLTAGVYLCGTLLLFITAIFHHGPEVGARAVFLASSTTAINTRSAGLPFEVLHLFSGPGQMLIVLLMIIGASPAGTGGGLKITTFWHLFTGFRDVLRGRAVHRAFGVAAVWLGAYLVFAGVGFLMLSAAAPQVPTEQAGFLTISALSNVGLSHDPVSAVGGALFVLDLIMLVGRLAPLGILWWMVRTTGDAEVLVA